MKSRIVSIPTGMLSSRLKEAVVTKNIWNIKNKEEAIKTKTLNPLFFMWYQKIDVNIVYSKNVYVTW